MKATDVLKRDHAALSALIDELLRTADDQRRRDLLDTIAAELEVHAQIEEEFFYPPLAALSGLIPEARHQHAEMLNIIANIDRRQPTSPDFILKVGQLRDAVQLHVAEEEGAIFRQAEQLGVDELEALGRHLEHRKEALIASAASPQRRAKNVA